jgi:hypothetical protein
MSHTALQFLEKAILNKLIQIIIFSVAALASSFLFVVVENKSPFPLIDFKLLANTSYFLQYNQYACSIHPINGCISEYFYFDKAHRL